jgi:hypothetical protein
MFRSLLWPSSGFRTVTIQALLISDYIKMSEKPSKILVNWFQWAILLQKYHKRKLSSGYKNSKIYTYYCNILWYFYNKVHTEISLQESWTVSPAFYVITSVLFVSLTYDNVKMVTGVTETRRCNEQMCMDNHLVGVCDKICLFSSSVKNTQNKYRVHPNRWHGFILILVRRRVTL